MPFFYRSHISRHHWMKPVESNYDAMLFAIPTQILIKFFKRFDDAARKIKQAIGESDICKKRAAPSAAFSGSLTVEAALALPVFLGALLLLTGLFQAMAVYEQINNCLCMTGRQLAAYSESCEGSSMADVWRLFYGEIADSGVDESIDSGYRGIALTIAEDEALGIIELGASYRIKIPGYLVGSESVAVNDRIYVCPWTGKQPAKNAQETIPSDREMVYVAENGVVFHTSEKCTYLLLSVRSCPYAAVNSLRNRYGARYAPCERCGVSGCPVVYITDTGRAWHSDRECSGLKRKLQVCSQEEAFEQGLRSCPRCGGH